MDTPGPFSFSFRTTVLVRDPRIQVLFQFRFGRLTGSLGFTGPVPPCMKNGPPTWGWGPSVKIPDGLLPGNGAQVVWWV